MAQEIRNDYTNKLKGFDIAVNDVRNTFENIADYLDIEDFELMKADSDFIADDRLLEDYTDDELTSYDDKVIMIKLVKDTVLRCLEITRDEIN